MRVLVNYMGDFVGISSLTIFVKMIKQEEARQEYNKLCSIMTTARFLSPSWLMVCIQEKLFNSEPE